MFLGGDGTWTEKDRKLALALTRYEAGMCACGYPSHVCHHPENDGYFEVDTSVCYATAAIELHRNAEGYTPDPGEQLGAVYVRTRAEPLPEAHGGLDRPIVAPFDGARDMPDVSA